MSYSQLKILIGSDIYRIKGRANLLLIIRELILGEAFKFIFWMRICNFSMKHPVLKLIVFPFSRILFKHYKIKYGISIPYQTSIQTGLLIGHFGGIVVNSQCTIGKNCNLSHGVTLGKANRGPNKGYPIIGDNVYIGPGAKIVGGVKVGSNAAIGANCVVTKDVPDNSVVVGIPGKVISDSGSLGYINKIDY